MALPAAFIVTMSSSATDESVNDVRDSSCELRKLPFGEEMSQSTSRAGCSEAPKPEAGSRLISGEMADVSLGIGICSRMGRGRGRSADSNELSLIHI